MARISPRHARPPRSKPPRPRRLGVVGGIGVLAVLGLVVSVAVALPVKRATALRQSQAVWSTKCNLSHQAPDDPIVLPARPGASHLHDFFGNVSVNANTTTASLARAASTCVRGMDEVDKAAYWTPALLLNGQPVTGSPDEHRIDAYYSVLDKPLPLREMPVGLRMIAGDSSARSPQPTKIVHYNCLWYPAGGQATSASAVIPTCPAGTYLSAKIVFPGCWDGVNLDSPDHKSHMAYPSRNQCPVTHPVRLPTLGIRLRWKTARGFSSSQAALSSGGQFSMHADFWNVWSPAVMQWLVDNCLNATRNCTDIARNQIPVATGSFINN
jgi:Domain of unknown function (DUF1996)